jgi:PAS domain-containing protein
MEFLRHGFEEPGDEQDIRLVVDTIPTLAWSAGPDGSADFVNQRWLDYTGLSAKQALGSGWQVAIHPDDLPLMIRASEDAYENLEGRRLEALARLFAQNVRIYVYPMTVTDLREWLKSASSTGWEWTEKNGWVSANQLRHAPPFGHLFAYLLASNFLVPMRVAPGT